MKKGHTAILIIFIFLTSCAEYNKLTKKKATLSFSINGNKKIIGDIVLSKIQLLSKTGEVAVLSKKNQVINTILSQRESPLLLSHSDINLERFTSLRLDITLPKTSEFLALDGIDVHNLHLIDALNRDIDAEDFTTSITIALDNPRTQHIGIQLDVDKSFNYLFKNKNSITTLFKPFFTLSDKRPKELISHYRLEKMIENSIEIENLLDSSKQRISLKSGSHIRVNNVVMTQSQAIKLIAQYPNGEFTTALTLNNGGRLAYNYADTIIKYAWVIKHENNETWIAGSFYSPESRNYTFGIKTLPSDTLIHFPSQQLEIATGELSDTLIGQSLSGHVHAGAAHIMLQNGRMDAILKGTQPMVLIPFSLNGFETSDAQEITIDTDKNINLATETIISLEGAGVANAFTGFYYAPIPTEKVRLNITLPASLSQSPLLSISSDDVWQLKEKLNSFAKIDLFIDNSIIRLNKNITHLDVKNANFAVYNDRILDSNRYKNFENLQALYTEITFHIEKGYHINELHISGILEGETLIADAVDIVMYGSSIYDLTKTSSVIEDNENDVNSADLEEEISQDDSIDDEVAPIDKVPLLAVIGGTVGALVLAGALVFLKKTFFNPVRPSSKALNKNRAAPEPTSTISSADVAVPVSPILTKPPVGITDPVKSIPTKPPLGITNPTKKTPVGITDPVKSIPTKPPLGITNPTKKTPVGITDPVKPIPTIPSVNIVSLADTNLTATYNLKFKEEYGDFKVKITDSNPNDTDHPITIDLIENHPFQPEIRAYNTENNYNFTDTYVFIGEGNLDSSPPNTEVNLSERKLIIGQEEYIDLNLLNDVNSATVTNEYIFTEKEENAPLFLIDDSEKEYVQINILKQESRDEEFTDINMPDQDIHDEQTKTSLIPNTDQEADIAPTISATVANEYIPIEKETNAPLFFTDDSENEYVQINILNQETQQEISDETLKDIDIPDEEFTDINMPDQDIRDEQTKTSLIPNTNQEADIAPIIIKIAGEEFVNIDFLNEDIRNQQPETTHDPNTEQKATTTQNIINEYDIISPDDIPVNEADPISIKSNEASVIITNDNRPYISVNVLNPVIINAVDSYIQKPPEETKTTAALKNITIRHIANEWEVIELNSSPPQQNKTYEPGTFDYLLNIHKELEKGTLFDERNAQPINAKDLSPLLLKKPKSNIAEDVYNKNKFNYTEGSLLVKFVARFKMGVEGNKIFQLAEENVLDQNAKANYNMLEGNWDPVDKVSWINDLNTTYNTIKTSSTEVEDNFKIFANAFKAQPNTPYALIPVTSGEHWSALILAKDTSGKISAFQIDPEYSRQTYDKQMKTLKSPLKKLFSEVPAHAKAFEIVNKLVKNNFNTEVIPLHPEIQKDGCSCGPIAMVAGKELIKTMQNNSSALNAFNPQEALDKIKANYDVAPGHEDIRLHFLDTLDLAKKLRMPTSGELIKFLKNKK